MFSLTIVGLQEIIPKLMALQKGWFKHARRDFGRFASLRTKRIGTWPSLTSPWVTGCPNTPLYLISLLIFYFLGRHPIPPSSIAAQMDQVVDLDSPTTCVATPLWAKCEDEIHTPKSGNLESFGTPATSELDNRGQNTLS
jgi:hypothetical protein